MALSAGSTHANGHAHPSGLRAVLSHHIATSLPITAGGMELLLNRVTRLLFILEGKQRLQGVEAYGGCVEGHALCHPGSITTV